MRNIELSIPVNEEEQKAIERVSSKIGLSVKSFIRMCALEKCNAIMSGKLPIRPNEDEEKVGFFDRFR